jgi:stearoyl-CoA desaturase (Delta-9 desaturase)
VENITLFATEILNSDVANLVLNFLDKGLLGATWWQILLYTLAATHLTIAGVTLYLHRSMAHRAVDFHPIVSHVFRMWLWLSTGMVTRDWMSIHRKHHAKCETEDDPHSPVTRGLKKVLLEGSEMYREEANNEQTKEKYGTGAPNDWIERNLYTPYSFAGVYVTLTACVLMFGIIGLSVFAIQMLWIPIFAAGVINGLGHAKGYRNFESPDSSTNLVPWGIIIGGEELHNNHHSYATSAKFSVKWYEFDAGWMYIRILSFFKLATVRRLAPVPKFVTAKLSVDADTLQAVIQHRYDLMAAYASSLRKICADEASRLKSMKRPEFAAVKAAKAWLHLDHDDLKPQEKATFVAALAASDTLRRVVEMRKELSRVWERSSLNKEQLLEHLQQWCHKAEASGIRALEEMALRMRRYAPAH